MSSLKPVWVLWPSFLVASAATGLFFTLVDPTDLIVFGRSVELGRMAVYTMGFFAFWALGAASSLMTCFLQRTAAEINRCPLPPTQRPPGCPKREEGGCC
jgi:hypothetical protein